MSDILEVMLPSAPVIHGGGGGPVLTTIYFSHYRRLLAVLAAAKTGDSLLLNLAVKYADKHGSGDEVEG